MFGRNNVNPTGSSIDYASRSFTVTNCVPLTISSGLYSRRAPNYVHSTIDK